MYNAKESLEIPNTFDSLFKLIFDPAVLIKYLAISIICFAFLILYLSIISLFIMSVKYCSRSILFFSSDSFNTISGKPPNFMYSSMVGFLLNSQNSIKDKGIIVNEIFLPVNKVDNSFESKDAEDPVKMNFIFSSLS